MTKPGCVRGPQPRNLPASYRYDAVRPGVSAMAAMEALASHPDSIQPNTNSGEAPRGWVDEPAPDPQPAASAPGLFPTTQNCRGAVQYVNRMVPRPRLRSRCIRGGARRSIRGGGRAVCLGLGARVRAQGGLRRSAGRSRPAVCGAASFGGVVYAPLCPGPSTR